MEGCVKSPVAAVIVAYHSSAEIGECLRSLRGEVEQIAVVDNAAEPALRQVVAESGADADLIVNSGNRGFAAAVNQGVGATTAPYVLLLNPDCALQSGLEAMVECCGKRGTVAAGGMLQGVNGEQQQGFFARSLPTPWALAFEVLGLNRVWPGNPINRRYRLLDIDSATEQLIGQPAGAFLLLRRDAFDAVGGMDESFHPIWFEDVDLCLRLSQAGGVIRYTPKAIARHKGAHSVDALPLQLRLRAWYGSLLRFSGKHYPAGTHRRLRLVVLVGLALRRSFCMFSSSPSAQSAAYGKTFQLVWNGFPNEFPGSESIISETSAAELS
jgi:N-acetylglucosaminyl-diphospho-decaprenol L-rhamnosyltransferase